MHAGYHTVERLERLGLIEVAGTGREGRRPERTVYSITEEGEEVFAERLAEMLSTEATEFPEFPVAVAFAHAGFSGAAAGPGATEREPQPTVA